MQYLKLCKGYWQFNLPKDILKHYSFKLKCTFPKNKNKINTKQNQKFETCLGPKAADWTDSAAAGWQTRGAADTALAPPGSAWSLQTLQVRPRALYQDT